MNNKERLQISRSGSKTDAALSIDLLFRIYLEIVNFSFKYT